MRWALWCVALLRLGEGFRASRRIIADDDDDDDYDAVGASSANLIERAIVELEAEYGRTFDEREKAGLRRLGDDYVAESGELNGRGEMMVEYLGGTFRVGADIFDATVKAKPKAASGGAKKQDGRGERSRASRRVIADDDDDDDETNVWEAEIESAVEFFRSVRGAVVDEREAAVLRHGAEEYLKDGGDAEFLTDYLASAFYVGRDDADVEEDRISRTIANLKAKAESGIAENQDVAGLRRVASDLEKNQEARRLATAFGDGGDHSERATAKLFKGLKAVYGVERADRDAYPPVLLELLASLGAIGLQRRRREHVRARVHRAVVRDGQADVAADERAAGVAEAAAEPRDPPADGDLPREPG